MFCLLTGKQLTNHKSQAGGSSHHPHLSLTLRVYLLCPCPACPAYSGDKLPWVGHLYSGSKSIYCVTGMSKWGLTNGVVAGQVLHDYILGKEADNKYAKMLDATRWSVKSAPGAIKEMAHTAQHMIGDKLKALAAPNIDTLKPGTGGLVKTKNSGTVGAYLDMDGKYHTIKPVCTHLGCHLLFNQGDACWDCPCHGSQFTIDGDVIHGPAVKCLEQVKDLQW